MKLEKMNGDPDCPSWTKTRREISDTSPEEIIAFVRYLCGLREWTDIYEVTVYDEYYEFITTGRYPLSISAPEQSE